MFTDGWGADGDESDENDGLMYGGLIVIGDIVEIATRNRKPILVTSNRFDDRAQLRVLGEAIDMERTMYLLLVTDGDAAHVTPTWIVNKGHIVDFRVDPRFIGCDCIISSRLYMRRVIKEQRGQFCKKCTEYNEEARIQFGEKYLCRSCRENPWR